MQFISCHNGKLQTLETAGLRVSLTRSFATGLQALDALAPQQAMARGAVHELLFDHDHAPPNFVAALFARAAAGSSDVAPIIWCDTQRDLYPPALPALGIDLKKLYLLHPDNDADESWAITECLRCAGVGAVVASPRCLSRIVARRLQLAAERGGSVGILLRPRDRSASVYAAATRWLVASHPGERTLQRWTIQLLHGHGGRIGQAVFLELCRETNSVRALEKLPDRQVAPAAQKRAIA